MRSEATHIVVDGAASSTDCLSLRFGCFTFYIKLCIRKTIIRNHQSSSSDQRVPTFFNITRSSKILSRTSAKITLLKFQISSSFFCSLKVRTGNRCSTLKQYTNVSIYSFFISWRLLRRYSLTQFILVHDTVNLIISYFEVPLS